MNTRNLIIPEGHKVQIVKDKTDINAQPNFILFGHRTDVSNKHGLKSICLLREGLTLSRSANTMLVWLKEGMEYDYSEGTNYVVKLVGDTTVAKRVIKDAYPELFARGLVRRVKRSHYMINPNAIMTDYAEQMSKWTSLPRHEPASGEMPSH